FLAQVEAKVTGAQASAFGWAPLLGDYFRKAHSEWDGVARSFDGSGPSISGVYRHLNSVTAEVHRQRDAVNHARTAWNQWSRLSRSQIEQLNAQFGQLSNTLDSLRTDITIRTKFITEGTPPSEFFHPLAAGGRADIPGYAMGGGVIKVGEQGPEYLSIAPGAGP